MMRPNLSSHGAALLLALAALGTAGSGPARADDFASCLGDLRQAALGAGVSQQTVSQATTDLTPNDAQSFEGNQPEFSTPPWDYMAGLVDEQRVEDGRARYAEEAGVLKQIAARFGVDPAIVVAIWGVESDYGRSFGWRPVVQSLATLSCNSRRPAFYRTEFVAALKILDRGDVKPENFTGSWAGAFGHTQFMPSTFLRHGVDFDGNGHPDIVDSVPDALATTAEYLHASGWQPGVPWGYEVRLPAGYSGPSGRKNRHPPGFWGARGITRADGQPLRGSDVGLLLPAGPTGPAFLVTRNFDALFTYNAAEIYALAIGHLADRIAGGGPLVGTWPTDDPGLSRVERREVQTLLANRGYGIEKIDGVLGTKTREAIASYQGKIGMAQDGRGSVKVLQALRDGR